MSGKVLFACSKCFSRHPFEELSAGTQLCKVSYAGINISNIEEDKKSDSGLEIIIDPILIMNDEDEIVTLI